MKIPGKKILMISAGSCVVILLFILMRQLWQPRPHVAWHVYQKQQRSIASRPSTVSEEKALRAAEKNLTLARSPEMLVRENRVVTGNVDKTLWQNPTSKIQMLNSPKDWQGSLRENLLRYQMPEVAIVTRPVESYILAAGNQGRYVEEVYVAYLQEGRMLSSYRAMVDSQSGEVLKTWSKSVSENLAHKELRLTPGE